MKAIVVSVHRNSDERWAIQIDHIAEGFDLQHMCKLVEHLGAIVVHSAIINETGTLESVMEWMNKAISYHYEMNFKNKVEEQK